MHAVFERNLARLRGRHPELAETTTNACVEAIAMHPARSGAVTLADSGILLGSRYDPVAEGRRLAEQADPASADLLVAVGVGLGHHIEAFRELAGCPALVYEPSPARLRALCSARDLSALLVAEHVEWAEDPADLAARFLQRYVPGTQIRLLIHPAVAQLEPAGVREAVERIARAKNSADLAAVTRAQMSSAWAELTAHNGAAILDTVSCARLRNAFRGMPAVVAAAGPSLEKQLPRLAEASGRVVVIAIGQSLRALRRAGIEPDLVHVTESQDVSHQIELAGAVERENLVVLPSSHPSLFRLPVRARFVATPASNPFAQWLGRTAGVEDWIGGGTTVAHSAVRLAAALGADPILLIGQDLAFTDGRIYARDTAYDMAGIRHDPDGRLLYTRVREKAALFGTASTCADERPVDAVFVEGWAGGRVPTSRAYASFLDGYADLAREVEASGSRLLNCTEGGARIPALLQLPFADALAGCAPQRLDPKAVLRNAHEQGPARNPKALAAAIDSAQRTLDRIEASIARARRQRQRARQGGRGPRSVAALRAFARAQRHVDRLTRTLPWLDALCAAELHHLAVDRQAPRGDEPELDAAIGEAGRLLEITESAVQRGRELLRRLPRETAARETAVSAGDVARDPWRDAGSATP